MEDGLLLPGSSPRRVIFSEGRYVPWEVLSLDKGHGTQLQVFQEGSLGSSLGFFSHPEKVPQRKPELIFFLVAPIFPARPEHVHGSQSPRFA